MTRLFWLAVVLLLLSFVSLAGGREWLSPLAIWQGLTDPDDFIIRMWRLPHLLASVGAGIALGLAGALMQGTTRNLLATPDVIGVTQGAGLGYVLALLYGAPVLAGATAGAALAILAVMLLSRGRGALAFVLFGIGVGVTAAAATGMALLAVDEKRAASALAWFAGSLARVDMGPALLLCALALAGCALVALNYRSLSLIWLGDEIMTSLGADPVRSRRLALVLVTGLCAASTLVVGPVAFLAFVSAPLARAVTGAERPALFPAALMGAILFAGADVLSRLAAPVALFPAGLLMNLIGAPYLLYFLWRERRLAR